uniref:endoplasmic reticulum membrane adapter protein XK n=1 Tax=Panthera onca TaxID=9690 RepID=UPI0029547B38|nr:endoplasmic reticulum membrane adapter protein XK [Panthera onca]
MKFPGSVLASVFLFVAETTAALYLSSTYRSGGDGMWQALTLLFSLLPCALVQLTLLFVHRDFSRDRPLVLLLHLLQLGPLFRCVRVPGPLPHCPGGGGGLPGGAGGWTRRRAQAGPPCSWAPQFQSRECDGIRGELELGIEGSPGSIDPPALKRPQHRGRAASTALGKVLRHSFFMVLSLLSIVYGALRCNILAIKIKYDEYDVKVKPLAYVCIFLWRSFEIATRVIVLVLFTSVLKAWVVMVVLINFFSFFLYPWILFWCSGSPFPENIEKALSRVGTTIVLCFLTLLYAGINMFCWSAVQLKINNPDLISKSQNWYRLLVYYMLRFIENAFLLLMWYLYKTDIYMYVCAPLLILQLLIGYCTAILFMLVFYQFFHPCKKLFSSSVSESFQEWVKCVCCDCRQKKAHESVGKTDLRPTEDRDETPSSSKISSVPSQILNADELCSA